MDGAAVLTTLLWNDNLKDDRHKSRRKLSKTDHLNPAETWVCLPIRITCTYADFIIWNFGHV